MDSVGYHLAFWSLAVISVGAALGVVVSRNLIHAVIFLILAFVGVAGLYLVLSAEFIAVVQVLVYVGAISVLMLFAILLTPRAARDNAETSMRYPAAILMGLVAAAMVFVALETDWAAVRADPVAESPRVIGQSLINEFVLPFEIAAVLLTAALVGAIALAREDPEDAPLHDESLAMEARRPGPRGPEQGSGDGGGGGSA